MVTNITLETPIKKLPPRVYQKFSQLNSRDEWRDLAVHIKNRDGSEKFADQSIIGNVESSKNPTKTLLDIWCYDGPRFATLGALIHALKAAELIHIVKYLYNDILKEHYDADLDLNRSWTPIEGESTVSTMIGLRTVDLPGPPLLDTPIQHSETCTVVVPSSLTKCDGFSQEGTKEDVFSDVHVPVGAAKVGAVAGMGATPSGQVSEPSSMVNYNNPQPNKQYSRQKQLHDLVRPSEPVHYTYATLASLTNNFDMHPPSKGGRLIGQGGYGNVFLALSDEIKAAVKVLVKQTDLTIKQFQTEVDILKRYKHPNILPLFGYSVDGRFMCIVTEYMTNGSLLDRLSTKNIEERLTAPQRVHVCQGVAKALHHLHTFNKDEPLVHRDVKSANVLLSDSLDAKLADCAMVRHGPTAPELTHSHTERILGTPQYVPPEYLDGEVSVRLDAYSYGVVLLEVLTSLPVYDNAREDKNLKVHINENCDKPEDIVDYLDVQARWDNHLATSIYKLASKFFLHKKSRPTISESIDDILSWGQ